MDIYYMTYKRHNGIDFDIFYFKTDIAQVNGLQAILDSLRAATYVHVAQTPPEGNTAGLLWWDPSIDKVSNLKILYQDADSLQWVDAVPVVNYNFSGLLPASDTILGGIIVASRTTENVEVKVDSETHRLYVPEYPIVEYNVLEGIIIDGTELAISDKKVTIPLADAISQDGIVTWEDKLKLDGIETGAQVHLPVTNDEIKAVFIAGTDYQTPLLAGTDYVTAIILASTYEPKNSNIQTHVTSPHAPSDAQAHIPVTKSEINAVFFAGTDYQIPLTLNTDYVNAITLGLTYEPKNVNIQSHISSPHAPSDAQAHIAPTKVEIEAVLTGEIDTHSHLSDNTWRPIVNDLVTNSSTISLSAAQGVALKGYIDAINTLLLSDNVDLDALQEIVDYIETNRDILDALGISNITGLQNALDAKLTTLEFSDYKNIKQLRQNYNIAYAQNYKEVSYLDGNPVAVEIWTNDSKSIKLFTNIINYADSEISSVVTTDHVSGKVLTKTLSYPNADTIAISEVIS